MVGFNLVASFNVADSFKVYSFYNPSLTPILIGIIQAVIFGICISGGGKQIAKITGILVPVMGGLYIAAALLMIILHGNMIPGMFASIFEGAFDIQAIFGGFMGSVVMLGIKRGLFSNEAGVGASATAAGSAGVSHPVKQGLVQVLSVFIDTVVICSYQCDAGCCGFFFVFGCAVGSGMFVCSTSSRVVGRYCSDKRRRTVRE